MTDGFAELDWSAPLDLEERLAQCPSEPIVKGMFYTQILDAARERGVELGPERYSAFKDYPVDGWLKLMARGAAEAFGDLPPSRGVCELARPTYPRFRESLIGRVIFTMTDFDGALRLASKAYRRVGPARCELAEQRPGHAILQLRNVWDLPAWHVGVYLGGFDAFGLTGQVRVRILSITEIDLELTWQT